MHMQQAFAKFVTTLKRTRRGGPSNELHIITAAKESASRNCEMERARVGMPPPRRHRRRSGISSDEIIAADSPTRGGIYAKRITTPSRAKTSSHAMAKVLWLTQS